MKYVVIEQIDNDFMQCLGVYDSMETATGKAYIALNNLIEEQPDDRISELKQLEEKTGYYFEIENSKTRIYILELIEKLE